MTTGQIASYGALQGTQREYETVMILRPQANKTDILALVKRLHPIFANTGGTLLQIDNWGIRILAYPVAHQPKGIYLYWHYVGGSDIVAEFERNLRNLDLITRYYTVRVAEDVDPTARPSEVTEDLLEAVSDPGPDPDEVRLAAEAEAEKVRAAAAAEAAAVAAAAAAAAAAAEPAPEEKAKTEEE